MLVTTIGMPFPFPENYETHQLISMNKVLLKQIISDKMKIKVI